MKYGQFTEDGREFVILRPDTPRPWVNCLTNGAYCAIISQTGGGFSFIGGAGYDRITRADPDFTTSDRPGRYVFVRDNDTGDYFSIGWKPVCGDPEWFECRHAPGLTSVASRNLGLFGRILFFVPLEDNLEFWRVRLRNERDKAVDLSVFTYVEWVLGNFAEDLEERETSNLFTEAGFHDNYIVATKRLWRRPDSASIIVRQAKTPGDVRFMPETVSANQGWGKYAFIALSVPVDGFDCDRQTFIGRHGHLGRPQVLDGGDCTNSDGVGRDAVGVLQARFHLQPGETVEFDAILGITLNEWDPSGIVARYSEPGQVEGKLQSIVSYWDSYTAKVTVSTPDEDINRSVNIWDKYQSWVSSRSFGLASPSRNTSIGFRENCFHLLGALPMDSEFSKSHTVYLMQHQYRDGSTLHTWEPRSDVGVRTGQLDDPLWLVFAITSYLKETGDLDFLNDRVKYYFSRGPATVYEHVIKAIDYCLSQVSPRGLLLIGPGDWEDGLDQAGSEGRGESVLSSQLMCFVLGEAARVGELRADRARARAWRRKADEIRSRLAEVAWDGEWFLRAIDDGSAPVGSGSNLAGQIYLNPQSWAVIAGTADGDSALSAMNSVRERLETPFGPALLLPAYPAPDRSLGTITRYIPGAGTNGGIDTLAVCWAVIAECLLGRGARAFETFKKLLYTSRSSEIDRYSVEPYAHPEQVRGPDSPSFGQGDFTWTAGVAAWVWRTCIDWICGVRPDYEGLVIDPCIPPDWESFSVIRPFRDAIYRITVRNPAGVEKGVRRVEVDGKVFKPGLPVPSFADRSVHDVIVTMG
ncbi:MAG: glycosyl transferase family 36 [Armatimonadetes bacterium]|nr:glycosyl transferase family 36 [Armatimonadota bacterium]